MVSYTTKLKDNHILLKAQGDISDICRPLVDYLGIGYFHFRRTFKDGSYLILATNSNWPLYFIEKNIPIKTPVSQALFNSKIYFCLWQGNIPDQTLSDAKNFYGIKNAIALVEKNDDYFDSYSFASTINCQNSTDIYINNMDAFSRFVPYFQEKSTRLIKEANKQIIMPPAALKDLNIQKIMSLELCDDKKQKFINAINCISFKTKLGRAILTKREAECLQHLARGKNRKEIARLISLSVRTVDTHLEKARNKLNCFTNSE